VTGPSLPLLPCVSRLNGSVDLSNVVIIACQHLLGTQLNLLDELSARGLRPQNFFLIGKNYSTNEGVYREFERRGVRVSPSSLAYDSHMSFDTQFALAAKEFLERAASGFRDLKPARIILVDVGGHLLDAAVPVMSAQSVPVVGIEQTSSGHKFSRIWQSRFPMIDVARSRAKNLEADFLAELTVDRIDTYIRRVRLQSPSILVVGQGVVGATLKNVLRKRYVVKGYDRHDSLSDLDGGLSQHLDEFDIVVGATGNTVFRGLDFISRKRAVHLISLSSSDREFAAVELRLRHPKSFDPHVDTTVGSVTLANSGFPINFDGSDRSLPPNRAQLVVALMLASIYQAAQLAVKPGIVRIEESTEEMVMREFERLNSETNHE
jgi:hypothetical protein